MSEGGNGAVPVAEPVAVYAGRRRLGYVIEEAAEWVAFNDDDQALGRYLGRQAAVAAVVAGAGAVR